MKKNGFTLVELLAVIVIIVLISLLLTPKVTRIIEENRIKGYKEIETRLKEASQKYILDNYIDTSLSNITLTKEQLINNNYIEEIKDLKDKSLCDAHVELYIINNKYIFIPYLSCSNYLSNNENIELIVNIGEGIINNNPSGIHNQNELIILEPPTRVNYEFAGWKITSGNGIVSGNTLIIGTKSTTVEAQWKPLIELIVNLNGGTFQTELEERYSSKTSVNLGIPTRANYEFDEWKVTSGNGIISGNTLIIGTEATTVEAQWISWIELIVNLDGGILQTELEEKYHSKTSVNLGIPTKENNKFGGWEVILGNSTISNSFLLTGTQDTTIKAIWIENKEYSYTGNVQEFLVPFTGIYKIELWGAQGGKGVSEGGKGGYTFGKINLQAGEKLYIYVGSKGNPGVVGSSATCPFNGGGNGGTRNYSSEGESGAGGGATDIRCFVSNNLCIDNTSNLIWSNDIGLKNRIMVAGGGGGGANFGGAALGGYAGGTKGSPGILNSGSVSHTLGQGGTQTSGGSSATYGGTSGSFGKGGNGQGTSYGAGGGSGYYGGGTGGNTGGGVSSGAGGSSYISGYTGCVAVTSSGEIKPGCANNTTDNSCSIHYSGKVFSNAEMKAGNEEMPTHDDESTMLGNSGNGYAKITFESI